jgi:hypothetical protein
MAAPTETGAEALIRAAAAAGVTVCFANPGCVECAPARDGNA